MSKTTSRRTGHVFLCRACKHDFFIPTEDWGKFRPIMQEYPDGWAPEVNWKAAPCPLCGKDGSNPAVGFYDEWDLRKRPDIATKFEAVNP